MAKVRLSCTLWLQHYVTYLSALNDFDRETPPKKNKAEFHRGGKAFLKLGFTAHCTQKRVESSNI